MRRNFFSLPAAIALLGAGVAGAADVVVQVSGITGNTGEIGCALFAASTPGFPLEFAQVRGVWLPADAKGVGCTFKDVADGNYAVSVVHDQNGNRRVDTNFLGIPTEARGVSNNVRPSLRGPRFDEAVFKVSDGRVVTLDIKVMK